MTRRTCVVATLGLVAMIVAGCSGGGAATTSPTAGPTIAASLPPPSDPPITLDAPAEATAGSTFMVSWSGDETKGDFFVIVPVGTTTWAETAESPYYNATIGNPITLTAPKTAGDYEIWFLKGDMERVQIIKATAPLKVK